MLYRFHVNLFALTDEVRPPAFTAFLPLTFEQALEALSKIPRLDAEPDGFFVVAGDHDGQRWQVDGHLFDFCDRLHRVELHGACPSPDFDALLGCFGWPQTSLAFELVREGVALDEPAFRQWASRVVPDPGASPLC